jgi:hypothetical protein
MLIMWTFSDYYAYCYYYYIHNVFVSHFLHLLVQQGMDTSLGLGNILAKNPNRQVRTCCQRRWSDDAWICTCGAIGCGVTAVTFSSGCQTRRLSIWKVKLAGTGDHLNPKACGTVACQDIVAIVHIVDMKNIFQCNLYVDLNSDSCTSHIMTGHLHMGPTDATHQTTTIQKTQHILLDRSSTSSSSVHDPTGIWIEKKRDMSFIAMKSKSYNRWN